MLYGSNEGAEKQGSQERQNAHAHGRIHGRSIFDQWYYSRDLSVDPSRKKMWSLSKIFLLDGLRNAYSYGLGTVESRSESHKME